MLLVTMLTASALAQATEEANHVDPEVQGEVDRARSLATQDPNQAAKIIYPVVFTT